MQQEILIVGATRQDRCSVPSLVYAKMLVAIRTISRCSAVMLIFTPTLAHKTRGYFTRIRLRSEPPGIVGSSGPHGPFTTPEDAKADLVGWLREKLSRAPDCAIKVGEDGYGHDVEAAVAVVAVDDAT
jgi:hypothetical protein